MAESDALVDFALSYASRGWAVLPCHTPTQSGCSCSAADCSAPGKDPRLVDGLRGATTDFAEIEDWWQRWPTANVAIRTGGVSGLVVIDVDRRGGGDRTLGELVRRQQWSAGNDPAAFARKLREVLDNDQAFSTS